MTKLFVQCSGRKYRCKLVPQFTEMYIRIAHYIYACNWNFYMSRIYITDTNKSTVVHTQHRSQVITA